MSNAPDFQCLADMGNRRYAPSSDAECDLIIDKVIQRSVGALSQLVTRFSTP
jgi:hypothetical protein